MAYTFDFSAVLPSGLGIATRGDTLVDAAKLYVVTVPPWATELSWQVGDECQVQDTGVAGAAPTAGSFKTVAKDVLYSQDIVQSGTARTVCFAATNPNTTFEFVFGVGRRR
jgi:hypothetical protein